MAKNHKSILASDSHAERHTSAVVVYAISILHCLDAQMRRVEPDGRSLADMDTVTPRLSLPALEELIRCLNRSLTLIGEALR